MVGWFGRFELVGRLNWWVGLVDVLVGLIRRLDVMMDWWVGLKGGRGRQRDRDKGRGLLLLSWLVGWLVGSLVAWFG